LLDIVRTDLTQLGFPQRAYEALKRHEAEFKYGEDRKDAEWFNNAANYLSATKQVLQCKLEACSTIMLAEELPSEIQARALDVLLDPNDPMALQHGIVCVMQRRLSDQYAAKLEEVSDSKHLQGLSLHNLKGKGLTGRRLLFATRVAVRVRAIDFGCNGYILHRY
jgi:hypothetical protein